MIKFILVALGLFLYLVLFIPAMLILLIVRKFRPDISTSVAQGMVSAVFRLMIFITGSKVEVRGSENIPENGGVLFVSNHRSYFDILTGYGYTKKPLGFVSKYEMIHAPLLKQWMDLLNCLFLNRKAPIHFSPRAALFASFITTVFIEYLFSKLSFIFEPTQFLICPALPITSPFTESICPVADTPIPDISLKLRPP